MNTNLLHKTIDCDFCVVGGGLAGSFAALAAARHGAKVVLIQDRPMLGGNASSEIRMWVRGACAINPYCRESGYISELEEKNIHGNPTLSPSVFDATLYGMLYENKNITLLLNASCVDAATENNKIVSVTAWQTTTYTWITVNADYFADCSGDSILAPLTGAEYRLGRESKDTFGETLAQDTGDKRTMGLSILLAARETDHPVKFVPPSFAHIFPDDSCFDNDKNAGVHAQRRDHRIATSGCNLWWVELGGVCDSIHDAEKVRDELLADIYGVWDHIKNRQDHGMENWDIEWVGFLPGKRESLRYVGDITVTEQDILSYRFFEDEIAYGGWPLDEHNPYGLQKNDECNTPSVCIPLKKPYGLPFRALCSKNIGNLLFAGRNISVSHVALSSTRVMATCALLGQAAGTGAALAVKYGCTPKEVYEKHLSELQKIIGDDGMYLPNIPRSINPALLGAKMNISEEDQAALLNGIERPYTSAGENSIVQNVGDTLRISFQKPEKIGTLRLVFDTDFERMSVSDNFKMRLFPQKLHTGKDFVPVRVAATLVKGFEVFADGKKVFDTDSNYLSLVKIPLDTIASEIDIKWISTNGAENVRLFSVDIL